MSNIFFNREIYGNLLDKRILEPMTVGAVKGLKEFPSGTQHFVTPSGMSSLVKYFISLSSPDAIKFLHHVSAINKVGDKLQVMFLLYQELGLKIKIILMCSYLFLQ